MFTRDSESAVSSCLIDSRYSYIINTSLPYCFVASIALQDQSLRCVKRLDRFVLRKTNNHNDKLNIQFYHFDGTFALMEKDDLDYGVIGNPTKASKEKGDALVEKVVEGYSAFIKDLLERHPVGINPLGFRNPLGFNGFNGGAYPTFDKDHDEKGRPIYYNK